MRDIVQQWKDDIVTALPVRSWRLWWLIVLVVGLLLPPLVMMLVGNAIENPALGGITQRVVTICAIIVLFALIHGRVTREDLGLNAPVRTRGSGLLVAVILFGAFALFVEGWKLWVPGAASDVGEQLKTLGLGKNVWHDVAMVVILCQLAPLVEEFVYRGVIFRGLRDGIVRVCKSPLWVGLIASLVLSSLLFVSVHASPEQMPLAVPYFVMGIVFALGYAWTGSIYVPILIHALNNTRAVWSLLNGAGASFAHPGVMALLFASPLVLLGVVYLLACLLPRERRDATVQ